MNPCVSNVRIVSGWNSSMIAVSGDSAVGRRVGALPVGVAEPGVIAPSDGDGAWDADLRA